MENRKQRIPLYWAIFAVAITLPVIVFISVPDVAWLNFRFEPVLLVIGALVIYVLGRVLERIRKEIRR